MTLLADIEPDLPFKGDRTYLHGTDIYPAFVEAVAAERDPEGARIRLAFRGFATHRCRLQLAAMPDSAALRPKEIVCEFSAVWNKEDGLAGWLIETGEEVTRRVPFDEDAICADAAIAGETIRAGNSASEATAIETAVALTKKLHYAQMPIESGRWVFSRLDIKRPLRPEDRSSVAVTLKHALGTSLTRSELAAQGETLGEIYFSVGHI